MNIWTAQSWSEVLFGYVNWNERFWYKYWKKIYNIDTDLEFQVHYRNSYIHNQNSKSFYSLRQDGEGVNWSELMTQTYELAEVCVETNYYGTKKMTKALLPLLQISDSPRVVSLTSSMGTLQVWRVLLQLSNSPSKVVTCQCYNRSVLP